MKVKLRLDFKGFSKHSYFLFGSKNSEKAAQEIRDQQIALLRNIPIQGIEIENINCVEELYVLNDSLHNEEVAYAPTEIILNAETLEDLIQFIVRDEFRKVEILEPQEIKLTKQELERLFVKINEEMKTLLPQILRKMER
ncbi:MAG: hypothetical protein ACI3ZR_06310 [bacterium]